MALARIVRGHHGQHQDLPFIVRGQPSFTLGAQVFDDLTSSSLTLQVSHISALVVSSYSSLLWPTSRDRTAGNMSHRSRGHVFSGMPTSRNPTEVKEMELKPIQAINATEHAPRRRALLIGIRYEGNAKHGMLPVTYSGVDQFLELLLGEYQYMSCSIHAV